METELSNSTENDTNENVVVSQIENSTMVKQTPSAKRKIVTTNKDTHSEERLQILKKIAERTVPQQDADENDLFFASMAKIVKKLPELTQAKLRMQIGTLVGNAELQHLSMSNPEEYRQSTSSSSTYENYDVFSPLAPSATTNEETINPRHYTNLY